MSTLADIVREHAPAYLARYGHAMPPSHARALGAIAQCRTAALGAELAHCDHCGTSHLLFHSCRHRACARCGHDTTERWIARQRENLLPAPYFHLVFTLPAELRRLVRSHQRILLDVLFRAAFESLTALTADPKYLGAQIGALAVLHTWTRTLEWHPHIHMLVPGGGLAEDGRTWRTVRRSGRQDFLVPVRALGKLFRGRFLDMGRRALPNVQFPHIPWGKSWIVYAKRSMKADPDMLLQYLARYVHRTALTDKRIEASDNGTVTFRYRDSRDGKRKRMQLGAIEFLRRFLQHVPPRGFHRVRAYGLLHPRHRHTVKRLQLLLRAVPSKPQTPPVESELSTHSDNSNSTQSDSPDKQTPSNSRLRCPSCDSGTLSLLRRLSPTEALAFEARRTASITPRGPPVTHD